MIKSEKLSFNGQYYHIAYTSACHIFYAILFSEFVKCVLPFRMLVDWWTTTLMLVTTAPICPMDPFPSLTAVGHPFCLNSSQAVKGTHKQTFCGCHVCFALRSCLFSPVHLWL